MQFSTIATALFAGLAAASPAARAEQAKQAAARTAAVTLTFWAAADVTYYQDFAVDNVAYPVYSDLSFTSISSNAPYGVECAAYGIDGSETTLVGTVYGVPIGPPQTQLTAKCWYL